MITELNKIELEYKDFISQADTLSIADHKTKSKEELQTLHYNITLLSQAGVVWGINTLQFLFHNPQLNNKELPF